MATDGTTAYCCYVSDDDIRCQNDAEFEITEERTDIASFDCYSYACTEHVGVMLGTVQYDGCDPDFQVHHWHLSEFHPGDWHSCTSRDAVTQGA